MANNGIIYANVGDSSNPQNVYGFSVSANGIDILAQANTLLQMAYYETSNIQIGSTGTQGTISYSNTVPSNTAGDQYLSLVITPKSSTSKLIVTTWGYFTSNSTGSNNLIGALYLANSALAVSQVGFYSAAAPTQFFMMHRLISGTLSPLYFTFRAGSQSGLSGVTNIVMNGNYQGQAIFGGLCTSGMKIEEYS